MEIHHDFKAVVTEKHWKTHTLEFLTLFLAVTLGFFTEISTERFIEEHRLHDYMRSMKHDLHVDIESAEETIACGDCNHFIGEDVTFYQLKNSGNFRYIRDINLYDAITDYYRLQKRDLKNIGQIILLRNKAHQLTQLISKNYENH